MRSKPDCRSVVTSARVVGPRSYLSRTLPVRRVGEMPLVESKETLEPVICLEDS